MGEMWLKPGMRVKYIGKPEAGTLEKTYLKAGMVGTVLRVSEWGCALVQWPEQRPVFNGIWWTATSDLKPI